MYVYVLYCGQLPSVANHLCLSPNFVRVNSLSMMKEGGKATLVIPSDLAYGDAGSGDTIPPGATLKFEVELFKVS